MSRKPKIENLLAQTDEGATAAPSEEVVQEVKAQPVVQQSKPVELVHTGNVNLFGADHKIPLSGKTVKLTNTTPNDITLQISGARCKCEKGKPTDVPIEIWNGLKNTAVMQRWLNTGCLVEGAVFTSCDNLAASVQDAPQDLKGDVVKEDSGMTIRAGVEHKTAAGEMQI